MGNQFTLLTVTPGFKLFAYHWSALILKMVKKNHIMENIILMHGEALLLILESFKCSFEFSNMHCLDMF